MVRGVLSKSSTFMGGAVLNLLVVLAFIAATGSGCRQGSDNASVDRPPVTGVTVSVVTPVRADVLYEATGTVRSDRTSIIASRVMGAVTSLNVKEGDTVRAGSLLLTLDDTDARQRLRAADMAVEAAGRSRSLAEATWRRYQGLFEQQVISRQEMDQVETGRAVAEAEYERAVAMAGEARTYLAFTRIIAAAPGMVTAKHIEAGSMATPGMPLLTIEGIGDAYVEVHADESFAGRIRPGMVAFVSIGSMKLEARGAVREVLPDIDPRTRTFTVKVDVPERTLRTGLFARVRIPVGEREILVVPSPAIVRRGQLTGVYVVGGDGLVTYRLIREGPPAGSSIEVLSGLSAGDRIITRGTEKAVDGGILTESHR